jgi:hypothetical protein
MTSCNTNPQTPALKEDEKKPNTTSHIVIKVERVMALPAFPSGSSLEFYKDRLYLTGDDATKLLILDVDYNVVDSILLFTNAAARIPKKEKADLESSTVVSFNGKDHLLLVGSGSLPTREKIILLPLQDSLPTAIMDISIKSFCETLVALGLKQVNIEGAATINNTLLLANRGNLAYPENHLVLTDENFWLEQKKAEMPLMRILLPATEHFAGISSLAYVAAEDLLFFAASTELTSNSFEDGAIGKSYIGWVRNASKKMNEAELKTDGFVDLVQADKVFNDEKIESLCITKSEGVTFTLHLVSDNDNGVSKLFKISLQIE